MTLSVDAKYGHDGIFDNMELRLATLVSERNTTFSDEFARHGHEYRFSTAKDSALIDEDLRPALSWDPVVDVDLPPAPSPHPDVDVSTSADATFEVWKMFDSGEIEDILHAQENLCTTNRGH